jgi:hypothetical protein
VTLTVATYNIHEGGTGRVAALAAVRRCDVAKSPSAVAASDYLPVVAVLESACSCAALRRGAAYGALVEHAPALGADDALHLVRDAGALPENVHHVGVMAVRALVSHVT